MHFQWASDDRWSQHVRRAWFMLELRYTYQQDIQHVLLFL